MKRITLEVEDNDVITINGKPYGEEWPKKGDEYWFILHDGDVYRCDWLNDDVDHSRRDYTGVYRTKEEAEAASDRIREAVRGLNA